MKVVLENIIKKFGEKTALKIDNYTVNSGEIVGLVGNNGAGKTTMFRVLLDLLKPDEGHASINDIITNLPTGYIAGLTRKIYVKRDYKGLLTEPANWKFEYVD